MTDPWTGSTPPPADSATGPPSGDETSESTSTSDAAKGEANKVAQTASDQAGQVADEAKTQASNVTAEARAQARDLAGEARGQVQEQANTQQQKVATQLRSVGDELSSMAQNGEQAGTATELVRQVSAQAQDTATWLESHEPGDVLDAVRDFARHRPGAFLAGAAVAGLVAGRLTRAGVDVHRDTSGGDSSQPVRSGQTGTATYGIDDADGYAATPAVEPAPATSVATADPVVDAGPDPSDPLTAHDDRGIR
ncbi:hypothetical protein BH20ACT6_BH20ACT6_14380 [soil metagenome]